MYDVNLKREFENSQMDLLLKIFLEESKELKFSPFEKSLKNIPLKK